MEFLGIDFDLRVMTVLFFAGFILAIFSNRVLDQMVTFLLK